MSKQANTTAIGAFVLGAIALAVAAVALLGGGAFFRESVSYVAVFDTSVKGLRVGAPIQFRGVPIGAVSRIEIARAETSDNAERILIAVFLDISPDYASIADVKKKQTPKEMRKAITELIQGGLKARLAQESFVTGLLEIELVLDPDQAQVMTGIIKGVPEIPVIPTSLEQAKDDIRHFIDELKKIPMAEMAQNVNEAIVAIRDLTGSPDLMDAIANLNTLLGDPSLQEMAKKIDKLVDDTDDLMVTLNQDTGPVLRDIGQAAKALADASTGAKVALAKVSDNIDQDSAVYYEINKTLEQVGAAALSLATLTNYLNQHPEALIKGKQPDKKEN